MAKDRSGGTRKSGRRAKEAALLIEESDEGERKSPGTRKKRAPTAPTHSSSAASSSASKAKGKKDEEESKRDEKEKASKSSSSSPLSLSSLSGWTEHTAPDGRVFYYNKERKESRWQKPAELADAEIIVKASEWGEHRAPDGRTYYHNKQTRESKWTKPTEMIEGEKAKERLEKRKRGEDVSTEAGTSSSSSALIVIRNTEEEEKKLEAKKQARKAERERRRGVGACDLCEFSLPKYFCQQCEQKLCDECMTFSHRRGPKIGHTYTKLKIDVKPLSELSVEELATWIAQYDSLRGYILSFLSLPVDGFILCECTEEDLIELGIAVPLHRKKLMHEVERAKAAGVDVDALDNFIGEVEKIKQKAERGEKVQTSSPSSSPSKQETLGVGPSTASSASSSLAATTANGSTGAQDRTTADGEREKDGTASVGGRGGGAAWIQYQDASGRAYYYNPATKETKWDIGPSTPYIVASTRAVINGGEGGGAPAAGVSLSSPAVSPSTSSQQTHRAQPGRGGGAGGEENLQLFSLVNEFYRQGQITEYQRTTLKSLVSQGLSSVVNALRRRDVLALKGELQRYEDDSDSDWDSD